MCLLCHIVLHQAQNNGPSSSWTEISETVSSHKHFSYLNLFSSSICYSNRKVDELPPYDANKGLFKYTIVFRLPPELGI